MGTPPAEVDTLDWGRQPRWRAPRLLWWALAVAALVAGSGWYVLNLGDGRDPAASPAPSPRDHPIGVVTGLDDSTAVVTDLSGAGGTGAVRYQVGTEVRLLTRLPDRRRLVNPIDLELAHAGESLALVGDDRLQVLGLGANTSAVTVRCRACTTVTWVGYRSLAVSGVVAGRPTLRVFDMSGAEQGTLLLPTGVRPTGYSPDRRRFAGVETLRSGADRVFVVEMDGSHRHPLAGTVTEPGRHIDEVQWSPDGSQVAYVERGIRVSTTGNDLKVATVAGGTVRQVTAVRTPAGFAWAPDGSALLAVGGPSEPGRVSPYALDGSAGGGIRGEVPIDWGRPAP